jgi:hypothetical protein
MTLIEKLLTLPWILLGYFTISKVIFPIITTGRTKKGSKIFNVPVLIDIFEIAILLSLLIMLIYSSFNPWTWDNLYFLPVFSLYILFSILLRISRMNGEIIIDKNTISIRKSKNETPQIIRVNKIEFSKDWNNEESTDFLKYKKWRRVHYLTINSSQNRFNLEEIGLDLYAIDILRALKKENPNLHVDYRISPFEKYYGIRWIYFALFALLSLYIYQNWDLYGDFIFN